jgi:ferritin-like metal-binding protein YciE
MNLSTLEDLFKDQLKDLYSAEAQLTKALPRMARAATAPELKRAFEEHLEETEGHVQRLQTLAEQLDIKLGRKKCKGMEGLIEEGKEVLDAGGDGAVIDAALIGAAQKVEHYEISAYGTARTLAEQLGLTNAVRTLQETLDEEEATDEKLTQISEGGVLEAAGAVEEDSDDSNS